MKKKLRASKKMNSDIKAIIPDAADSAVTSVPAIKLNKVFIILLYIFLAFNAVQLIFYFAKVVHKDKYPVLAGSWNHNYQGCTSIGEYGNYIYAVDNTRGDVYINKKDSGDFVKKLNFKEGVLSVAEDSKGYVYILDRADEVLKLDPKSYSVKNRFKPESAGNAMWMDVDDKDNFYLVSAQSSMINKYGPDFKKIVSFGGRTGDNSGFTNAGKCFVSPKNELYVFDYIKANMADVKIFSTEGKYLRSWQIKGIKSFDGLTNMGIAANGDTYINATSESRIYVFSASGKELGSFSGTEDKVFNIVYAASVTGGRNGIIYVHTHKIAAFKTIDYSK
jgi:hypothetical protein